MWERIVAILSEHPYTGCEDIIREITEQMKEPTEQRSDTMIIKTGNDLAAACLHVARNYKTLYVMGCFGAPMTESNKERYIAHHDYNARDTRKKLIRTASADTFGFDCVNLIKGLLWGWDGDTGHIYGGADYACNGVPDTSADGMIGKCKTVSTDFSDIQVGELLWMKGHVGIYIGDGLCVECTPAWKNCVQVTAVHNIGKKEGYNGRKWTKHGKLPYVSYEPAGLAPVNPFKPVPKPAPLPEIITGLPLLKKGSRGQSVKALQILLKGYGYSLGSWGIDSSFGSATEEAVKLFQKACGLEDDGEVGPKTWAALLGV
jgi:hypothetical protein